MADDAGALLVRSGLVSASTLDQARARVSDLGGTLGEQLVATGAVSDEALTDFYKARLLVPQVNPNTLARLPAKVVAVIPSEMAIELRAIPVSLDRENNLTVAMSDPSDRHAVDEISFFTGAYVVRAVATQMQIAWCLAHYYGHVTHLGQRLLQPEGKPDAPARTLAAAVKPGPRPRGDTVRSRASEPPPNVPSDGVVVAEPARSASGEIRAAGRRAPSIKPDAPDFADESSPIRVPGEAIAPEPSGPVISIEAGEPSGPTAGQVTARAAEASLHSGPVISLEADEPSDDEESDADGPPRDRTEEPTERALRAAPRRVRPAEPDPPELAARAGEVDLKTGPIRVVAVEEPRVVIAEELEEPPPPPRSKAETLPEEALEPDLPDVSGEFIVPERSDLPVASQITVEITDEPSAPVVIHEQPFERSEPVLLERRREDAPTEVRPPILPELVDEPEPVEEVLELPPKRAATPRPRGDRRTQLGVGIVAAQTRRRADDGVPGELDDQPTGARARPIDDDPTRLDTFAVAPGDYTTSDEVLAAPPSPASDDDTSPVAIPPAPGRSQQPVPPPSGKVKLDNVRARAAVDEEDDDGEPVGPATAVMSTVELEEVMTEPEPKETGRRVDYDPVDDGWGPPGTTIPPPLLGEIPGAGEPQSGIIPISNIDSAPLMVAPPLAPEASRPDLSAQALARAFDEASARMLALLHELELAQDRDQVVSQMVGHLARTHRRAGFFAVRAGELSLFALQPRPATLPFATLRLDRPSTFQDVVGTRLPYRGPTADTASHDFLVAALGAAPPEILLVPVTVRERVVGVLFGETRTQPSFDDQLALAARAAGFALERILKARRT